MDNVDTFRFYTAVCSATLLFGGGDKLDKLDCIGDITSVLS